MKRGDIYWANLIPRSGSEQTGRRPVIIVSHDGFNKINSWRSIIVVPLSTSTSQAKRGPTAISISSGDSGLSRDGIALCHQVTTLDREKLTDYVGSLSSRSLKDVEKGLLVALDIEITDSSANFL